MGIRRRVDPEATLDAIGNPVSAVTTGKAHGDGAMAWEVGGLMGWWVEMGWVDRFTGLPLKKNKVTLHYPSLPRIMVQWKMDVSPIWVTFHLGWIFPLIDLQCTAWIDLDLHRFCTWWTTGAWNHPTCVCPSGEGFHFTIRPPDAADCAQAKEQPSTQKFDFAGGSITVSLPWLAVEELSSYINFINMHLLDIMPIFFTREIYHTAWTYIF